MENRVSTNQPSNNEVQGFSDLRNWEQGGKFSKEKALETRLVFGSYYLASLSFSGVTVIKNLFPTNLV